MIVIIRRFKWLAALASIVIIILLYLVIYPGKTYLAGLQSLFLGLLPSLLTIPVIFLLAYYFWQDIQQEEINQQREQLTASFSAELQNLQAEIARIQSNKYKSGYSSIELKETIQRTVQLILEAATRMLIFPNAAESKQLRAFCHLADKQHRELYPLACWSAQAAKDSKTRLPYEGPDAEVIVVAEAFTRKIYAPRNLPDDHLARLTPALRKEVDPDLTFVVAAPILSSNGKNVIGTISFDSETETVEQMGFDTPTAQHIVEVFASSLGQIIGLVEVIKEKE